MSDSRQTILLTGASGYIGGRLLRRLEQVECRVRCLTRRPEALVDRTGAGTEIIAGDLLDPGSLPDAMRGVTTAYYLVHSMDAAGEFAELDHRAATNFAQAARDAGVARIVYLGGLGSGSDLSEHLASRHQVGRILRASGVTTIELRASIVIGPGSASFETVRALVEILPAIPAPSPLHTAAQPIAIADVIEYLVAAIALEAGQSAIFEIGGRERTSYAELMREYAHQRSLRRPLLPLPPVGPRTSRFMLGLLTPRYGRIASAMADSVRNETVVRESTALYCFLVKPRGLSEAIQSALAAEDCEFADTRWGEALPPTTTPSFGGLSFGRRRVSSRAARVSQRPATAFVAIQRIGGQTGWYAFDWFWRVRGCLDSLRGGIGMRRGRPDPHHLRVGDHIDFWRVERIEPGRRLLLAAEMKMPGRLWLQFEVEPREDGAQIRQTTVFEPAGYIGLAYWYLFYPLHDAVFRAMLQGLRKATLAPPATC